MKTYPRRNPRRPNQPSARLSEGFGRGYGDLGLNCDHADRREHAGVSVGNGASQGLRM